MPLLSFGSVQKEKDLEVHGEETDAVSLSEINRAEAKDAVPTVSGVWFE
jgi:hypothetical protein